LHSHIDVKRKDGRENGSITAAAAAAGLVCRYIGVDEAHTISLEKK
jgi:hypothetical protein